MGVSELIYGPANQEYKQLCKHALLPYRKKNDPLWLGTVNWTECYRLAVC